jgi:hypothetical protein
MGPNVSILTPIHPLMYQERNQYYYWYWRASAVAANWFDHACSRWIQ